MYGMPKACDVIVVYSVTPKPPADKKYECSYQIIILDCFHLFDNFTRVTGGGLNFALNLMSN